MIASPGEIEAGDEISVLHHPDHEIRISLAYRALTTERQLLPRLREAWADEHGAG